MLRLRPIFLACALLLLALTTSSRAAVPASGTLSPGTPVLDYTAGPFTSVNPSPQTGDPDCTLFPNSCDDYALTVDVSAGYLALNPDHVVTIRISWPTPQNDFDVYLRNAANTQTLASSASSGDPEVIVFTPTAGVTTYHILALAFSTVNESISGHITLGPRPTGATGIATYLASTDVFTCNVHLDGDGPIFNHGGDGEPSVKFDKDGNAWVAGNAGLGGGQGFWKIAVSDVCAQSPIFYDAPDLGIGGGDSDLEIAPERNLLGNYNIYTSSLTLANITSATSLDNGNTFVTQVISDPAPVNDRQWNACYGANTLYLSWRSLNTGNQLFCARSDDAGITFGPPIPVYDDIVGTTLSTQLGNMVCDQRPGATVPLATGPDGQGNVYHGYNLTTQDANGHKIYMAVSRDFGLTWFNSLVYAGPPGATYDHIFTWVAVDGAGNVFTVWSDGNNAYYSFSSDLKTTNSATWSAPVRINNGADSKTCVLPMIAAGSDGRIVVAWYGTSAPSLATPGAQWHYFHTRSNNATAQVPTFEQVRVSDHVVHTGVVCEDGLGCSCCRDLLECQELDVNPTDGSTLVSYGGAGGIFITKQVAGASAVDDRLVADNSGPCPALTDNPPCAASPPQAESACILPGITVATDPTGDVTALGNAGHDIERLWVAEPDLGAGVDDLVLTMQVNSIDPANLPLSSNWYILFDVPGATNPRKFVAMETCDLTAVPSFSYGYLDPTLGFQGQGNATGSVYPDGRIEIRISRALVGDPQPSTLLQNLEGDVRVFVGAQCTGLVSRVDGAIGGNHLVQGNGACRPHTVSCPPTIVGTQGFDEVAEFFVHNPSTTARRFDVTLTDTQGWIVGGPVSTTVGPVSPGSSASISVAIRVPPNCVNGSTAITWTAVADDLPAAVATRTCMTNAMCDQATATVVERFEARRAGGGVELLWSARDGAEIVGWNLYRCATADGVYEGVNSKLIPVAGASQFRYVDETAPSAGMHYRLAGVASNGTERTFAYTASDAVGRPHAFAFALSGANPFRGSTQFTYAVAERGLVRLEVFSITGQRVRTLVNLTQEPGTYTVPFSLGGQGERLLSPGVYLVRIAAGRNQRSKSVLALE